MNLGAAKPQVRRERSVWALGERVNVSFHQYTDVMLRDFVAALARGEASEVLREGVYHDNLVRERSDGREKARGDAAPLTNNDLLLEVNEFLAANKGYHVFAESGDMLFGGLELRLHGGGLYFAQGYYASMGFAVPASLGAQIGTGVRPLVLCGDGGFQMTGLRDFPRAKARALAGGRAAQQLRLADLPARLPARGSALPAELALCGARPGVGRRRISRANAGRTARGPARRPRSARVRADRVPDLPRTTSLRSPAATSAQAPAAPERGRLRALTPVPCARDAGNPSRPRPFLKRVGSLPIHERRGGNRMGWLVRTLCSLTLTSRWPRSGTPTSAPRKSLQRSTCSTRPEIVSLGVRTLPDVLRAMPGIRVTGTDERVFAVTASSRGESSEGRLLVLIDGRQIERRSARSLLTHRRRF